MNLETQTQFNTAIQFFKITFTSLYFSVSFITISINQTDSTSILFIIVVAIMIDGFVLTKIIKDERFCYNDETKD